MFGFHQAEPVHPAFSRYFTYKDAKNNLVVLPLFFCFNIIYINYVLFNSFYIYIG